ncbi:putative DNA-directed RNA polymerase subunit delta [Jeotgalibaca dankookensis]|uniref:Probable DNA-directed RNA polymerase subunit delta n=1 Tax=Jeotgalibaca dankookensis TaxID=708126 RepID=A0A1S6IRF0_9LACT|nr:DNA-directed RNA polymerase subunit delta [Jeotgalibaca dankookensis]AQS54060.1 putative DNA-directed RNA polymerase subunit delta [Jeotgalibaca dankookensis]
MKLTRLDGINKNELSMIEVAHEIFEETGEVLDFNDLLAKVQDYIGLSEAELEEKMTRFYTNLNIDGSFISLGENRWGLRSWYPIDSIDEEILSTIDEEEVQVRRKKRKKLNAFATSEDDDVIDYNDDDPEDTFSSDEDEDDVEVDEEEVEVEGDDLDADLDEDLDDVPESIEEDLTIIEDEELEDEEEEEE